MLQLLMYIAVDLGDCLVSSSVDLGWTHHNSSSLFYTQFCLVALLGLYIMVRNLGVLGLLGFLASLLKA